MQSCTKLPVWFCCAFGCCSLFIHILQDYVICIGPITGIILCMCLANERWWCYNVTLSLNGWAHAPNDPRNHIIDPVLVKAANEVSTQKGIFGDKKVNTMPTDSPALCSTGSLAAMLLTMHGKWYSLPQGGIWTTCSSSVLKKMNILMWFSISQNQFKMRRG